MQMIRHYIVSDDLDDLEELDTELEKAGLEADQLRVLSLEDWQVDRHDQLHAVPSLVRNDVLFSGTIGFGVGIVLAALVLGISYALGWSVGAAGWLPFVFLAIVLLGFATWEGAFFGFQTPNRRFEQFQKALDEGRHVFFVDLDKGQEDVLHRILKRHPRARKAGTGGARPHWSVAWQGRLRRLFTRTLP